MLHPFPTREWRCLTLPGSLQLLHFHLQPFQLFLQFLVERMLPRQFGFQFRDPLVFRAGLGGLVPLVAHLRKFTAFDPWLPESFGLPFPSV